jgi:glutathione peroxidase
VQCVVRNGVHHRGITAPNVPPGDVRSAGSTHQEAGSVSIHALSIASLDGRPDLLDNQRGKVALLVNVASKCGLTPQYEQLQALQDRFGPERFTVIGFPCNQFLEQEPGTPEEIASFCSLNYGVTFPLSEKIEVNGPDRHPLYAELCELADGEGHSGDIRWNFEKFLVDGDGSVVARFSPTLAPDDAAIVSAIEAALGDDA